MLVSVFVSIIMAAPIAVINSTVKIAINRAIPRSECLFFMLRCWVIEGHLTGSVPGMLTARTRTCYSNRIKSADLWWSKPHFLLVDNAVNEH